MNGDWLCNRVGAMEESLQSQSNTHIDISRKQNLWINRNYHGKENALNRETAMKFTE